jgi:hypothetical protein
VDKQLASQSMNLEYMKFWYENSSRGEISAEEKPTSEQQNQLKKLASYVPKLVMRRLYNDPSTVRDCITDRSGKVMEIVLEIL